MAIMTIKIKEVKLETNKNSGGLIKTTCTCLYIYKTSVIGHVPEKNAANNKLLKTFKRNYF